MHRLSRHILCSGSPSRAVHTKRLSHSLGNVSFKLSRQYASTSRPSSSSDKFDKLYASLRPTMQMEQLATTYAALIGSTKDQEKIGKLQKVVSTYLSIGGINEEAFYTRVNDILSNPPDSNFDSSFVEPSSTESSSQLSEHLNELMDVGRIEVDDIENTQKVPKPVSKKPKQNSLKQSQEGVSNVPEGSNQLSEMLVLLKNSKHIEVDHTKNMQKVLKPVSRESKQDSLKQPQEGIYAFNDEVNVSQPVSEANESEPKSPGNKTEGRMTRRQRASKLRELGRNLSAQTYQFSDGNYPNLMETDPLLDYRDVLDLPPDEDTRFHNRVIVRNHTSVFNEALAQRGSELNPKDYEPTTTDETEESASSLENLPLSPKELSSLYRFPLVHKRITQQTGKGKIHRQFVLMVVGDGNGMVGYGQGKDDDASRAVAKAFAQAVRNMDWVERFENRTIWTEMETKLGATQIILRPRPVGFGLRCNPNLHQVLKAAGIKDVSAKVWGSRNPINVIKAAFRMLQAGHAPLSMGDGIGGPGRKLNKGHGLRSKDEVERERGRQLVSLRK